MKNVWETCKFSDEIVNGDLERYKFAVELHDFLEGKADPVYQDPETCMDNTFLTEKMEYIIKDAILRVSSSRGTPITAINTGFGGGKTHTIILLHHIFNNKDLGARYLSKHGLDKKYGIAEIPDARMVAIDCRDIKKNTLWGEIANRMGKYDLVKTYDEHRQPIQDMGIIKSFFDGPTIMLIDELPHYMLTADSIKIGNVTLANLVLNFIEKLISVVASSRNSCLILTLTDKQPLYEKHTNLVSNKIKNLKTDQIDENLKETLSRQVSITTPVTQKQIYDVVRKRLIKQIAENERDITVQEYSKYLDDNGLRDYEYKNKMISAYPFHPFLIDILYERVSTIPKFNKTRGILLLLGLILHNVLKNEHECYLVGTSDIDLSHDRINDALTSQIDKDLKQVIDSDCIKHALDLDRSQKHKIHTPIARTIYVHSLTGFPKKSGIRSGDLKLAVCRPHIDPNLVDEALKNIEERFWYVKAEGEEYYFDEVPNINKIILERLQDVTDVEVRRKIEYALRDLMSTNNNDIYPIIWDRSKLEESDKIRLFVVDYEKNIDDDEIAKNFISDVLENMPNDTIREKQNTIVVLYADRHGVDSLKEKAKILCAIEKTEKDETIKLNGNYMSKMKARLEQQKHQLKTECSSVYCKIGYPDGPIPRLDLISMLDSKSDKIPDVVFELLERKGKLIPELGPDGLPEIKTRIQIKKIHDKFKTDKSKKFVSSRTIRKALQLGIERSRFGYAEELIEKDGKYVADIGKYVDIGWSGWMINKDEIYKDDSSRLQPSTPTLYPEFNYEIICPDLDTLIRTLNRLSMLSLEKFEKSLMGNLRMEPDTEITIKSELEEYQKLGDFLQSIRSKISGQSKLTIKSKTDLRNEFEKYDIEAKRI